MTNVWSTIAQLPGCRRLTPPNSAAQFFLFQTPLDETCWLVGPYNQMTPFATNLRGNPALRNFVSANGIRLGLRDTDVPPAGGGPQARYGATVRGPNYAADFTSSRSNPLTQPAAGFTGSRLNATAQSAAAAPVNRKTDRQSNVECYWASQTPQSHHIVEFNNLETLGVSNKVGNAEMDYLRLPAVLLAAELHQRYISKILKPAQQWAAPQLKSSIADVYKDIYLRNSARNVRLFEPLWRISQVILKEAGIQC